MVIILFFLIENPVEPKPLLPLKEERALEDFNEFRYLALYSIRLYQIVLSGQQGEVCNFEPSCSRYAYRAIKKYGPFWGILMAIDRIERCNPFTFHYVEKFYKAGFIPGKGYLIIEKPEDIWKYR